MSKLDGREISVEAVAAWLAGLPAEYQLGVIDLKQYGCRCLVGAYANQDAADTYWVFIEKISRYHPNMLSEELEAGVMWLTREMTCLIDLFDTLTGYMPITAGELRRRIVAFLLLGEVE